jgi:hypothetical protein
MKLSLLFVGVLALGCSKSVPPKTADAPIHRASEEDCVHVYERLLAISLTEMMEPGKPYLETELQVMAQKLDEHYRESGATAKFWGYCTQRLNTNQTSCMLACSSLEAMDMCDKLFATPAKKD